MENTQNTQVEVPEVVSGDVVTTSAEDSGSSTLVAMAVGAGLFALGVGAVKGVKCLIAKAKAKKAEKIKAEVDDDDEFDDFEDDEPAAEEAEAEEVKADEPKKKKN
jgi:hypothetical protein